MQACFSLFIFAHACSTVYADMAELADALDLGSSGQPCRFKSCYPHGPVQLLPETVGAVIFDFVRTDIEAGKGHNRKGKYRYNEKIREIRS